MNIEKIKTSLQNLIYRLQDAEKGYQEIQNASSNTVVNKWLDQYAKERHNMHRVLEEELTKLGGEPDVDTTLLGDLHRMFIDIKINNTSADNEFTAVVDEIERGATKLIDDYQKVLSDVEMPPALVTTLMGQKLLVQNELDTLTHLRDEIEEASKQTTS